MTKEEIRNTAQVLDNGSIAVTVDETVITGSYISDLAMRVDDFNNGDFDYMVAEFIEALTDSGVDLCVSMDKACENFKVSDERVDTAWIDYISQ